MFGCNPQEIRPVVLSPGAPPEFHPFAPHRADLSTLISRPQATLLPAEDPWNGGKCSRPCPRPPGIQPNPPQQDRCRKPLDDLSLRDDLYDRATGRVDIQRLRPGGRLARGAVHARRRPLRDEASRHELPEVSWLQALSAGFAIRRALAHAGPTPSLGAVQFGPASPSTLRISRRPAPRIRRSFAVRRSSLVRVFVERGGRLWEFG